MKRLLKNPILVCHVISITLQVNGFAGYFVFMPKFMESQYQTSASDASLFSGNNCYFFHFIHSPWVTHNYITVISLKWKHTERNFSCTKKGCENAKLTISAGKTKYSRQKKYSSTWDISCPKTYIKCIFMKWIFGKSWSLGFIFFITSIKW